MLPPRPPAGAAASRAEARRGARRAQPESPGRPDVAGTQRRLVLPHTPLRLAARVAGVAAAAGVAASKAAFVARAAPPTSSHPHTERDNKQSHRRRGRLPLVRHNTAHTHSHTREGGREGGRGGRPAVSQRFGAQSGPFRRNPSANPKIPSPRRGGTRGGNVIAGSNRREDLGFFVCVCVCRFSI